ncbi:MAG: cupin domain-containing protein [Faecalibacillus sp.]
MIRRQNEQKIINIENPQNGNGILTLRKILNSPDELDQKGRAFNHCFLEPGSGLGYHQHIDTTETMYILKGQARYVDENGETILNPGDVTFTDINQSHSIYAIGNETLEMIALVLFKGE